MSDKVFLTIEDVHAHLLEMKNVYDATRNMSPLELYKYFRDLERQYMKNRLMKSYCSSVHKLHPVKYVADNTHTFEDKVSWTWTLSDALKCPKCAEEYSLEQAFKIHIEGAKIPCEKCQHEAQLSDVALKMFVKRWNLGKYPLGQPFASNKFPFEIPEDLEGWEGLFPVFRDYSDKKLPRQLAFTKRDGMQVKRALPRYMENISSLTLDLVRAMYRQLDFVNKICCNMDYWNRPEVLSMCVARYNKFMNLIARGGVMLVPTMDIDLAWHSHQTMPDSYKNYCNVINKGVLINHDDTIVSRILNLGFARTFVMWSQHYHEPYSQQAPKYNEWVSGKKARCLFYIPVMMYRSHVWSTHSKPRELTADEKDYQQYAIVGTPVIDFTKRPRGNGSYEVSLYAALAKMNKVSAVPSGATSEREKKTSQTRVYSQVEKDNDNDNGNGNDLDGDRNPYFFTNMNLDNDNDRGGGGGGGGCSAYFGGAGGCGGGCSGATGNNGGGGGGGGDSGGGGGGCGGGGASGGGGCAAGGCGSGCGGAGGGGCGGGDNGGGGGCGGGGDGGGGGGCGGGDTGGGGGGCGGGDTGGGGGGCGGGGGGCGGGGGGCGGGGGDN